jgi:hypothetical protein
MRKTCNVFAGLIALLGLTLFASTAHAENAPAQTSGANEASATRVELMVVGRAPPPKPEDAPKPDAGPKAAFERMAEMRSKAAQDAVANAVKMTADLSAQWPKCRFRVASMTVSDRNPGAPEPLPNITTMLVTLLGENGCLTPAK